MAFGMAAIAGQYCRSSYDRLSYDRLSYDKRLIASLKNANS
jgi:hypothetical protein